MKLSKFCSAGVLVLCGPGSLEADPISGQLIAHNAASDTSSSITGPIILSDTRMIFGNGASSALQMISENGLTWEIDGKATPIQIFRFESEVGELLNGNRLCGADEPGLAVFFEKETLGIRGLHMEVYQEGAQPVAPYSDGLCGTFAYEAVNSGNLGSGSDVQQPLPEPSGKWLISRDVNVLDDTRTVVLSLQADSGVSSFGDEITLIARCQSNRTEAFIVWNDYLGNDGGVGESVKDVVVRFGEDEAQGQIWNLSTDSQATFVPGYSVSFLKRLSKVDRFVIKTVPYNENPKTAVFDVRGLGTPLSELAATCGWQP